ncbi:MAG: NAD(P)-dependent oxidoreductase [Burkholderiaceae bacterium]
MSMSVGMIGVGLMGHGIAHNLVKKGFAVSFLEHPGNQPVADLVSGGAIACQSTAEVAARADVVIICVTGAPQVEAVVTGAGGLLEGLKPGTIVVDCSTSLPETTARIAPLVQARGAKFLDAPMTRLAKEAREGRLNLLVGGDAAVLDAVRPVLDAFCENITRVGPVGAGHRMKLLHNFVSVGTMTLISEAAAHAATSGIDMKAFVDVLAKGGGNGVALDRLTPSMLEGDPSRVAFTLVNGLKDLSYYVEMAKASGARAEVASAITATLKGQVDAGHAEDYVPELVRLLQVER